MRPLGIEFLSAFGLPPVELVHLAADLGCQHISVSDWHFDYNPHRYPPYSLVHDAALRREMTAVMADRSVWVSLGEGCVVTPDGDVRDHAARLDAYAELGARWINTLSFEQDMARSVDQFGRLAEMAAARGIQTALELSPTKQIGTLPLALEAISQVGRADFRLTVDTMHFTRAGATPEDLAAVDPALIGYCQLCDVPLKQRYENYMDEAAYERMVPGTGELPLPGLLAALPRDTPIGLEIPIRSLADQGLGPKERLGPCVAAARRLLAELEY